MAVTTIIGIAIIIMFISSLYGFLIGSLVITLGNFAILTHKYRLMNLNL